MYVTLQELVGKPTAVKPRVKQNLLFVWALPVTDRAKHHVGRVKLLKVSSSDIVLFGTTQDKAETLHDMMC